MKYCIKCGNQLPDEAVFCDRCGQKTQAPQPAAGQPVQTIPPRDLRKEKAARRNGGIGVLLILASIAMVVAVILIAIAQYNR